MHPKHTKHMGHKQLHHRGKHAHGGHAEPDHDVYAGEHSNVIKEAEEKKSGGRAGKKGGGRAKKAAGGPVAVEGMPAKARLDRPGRKRGGRAGADKAPLTTASHVTSASAHKSDTGMAESETHAPKVDH